MKVTLNSEVRPILVVSGFTPFHLIFNKLYENVYIIMHKMEAKFDNPMRHFGVIGLEFSKMEL